MRVSKKFAGVILPSLVLMFLAGCASTGTAASPATCGTLAQQGSALDILQVSGEFGEEVSVSAPGSVKVQAVERVEQIKGSGRQITSPFQVLTVDIKIVSSEDTNVSPESNRTFLPLSRFAGYSTVLPEQLMCASAGSRVTVAVPAEKLTEQVAAQLGAAPGTGIFFVMDILEVERAAADGAPVVVSDNRLPSVVRAPSGQPGIIFKDAPAPTEVLSAVLLQGDGPELTGTEQVIFHYTSARWDGMGLPRENAIIATSWEESRDPANLPFERFSPDVASILKGKRIGSQVLIVLPAGGDIDASSSDTFAQDTATIYVIDLLGVVPSQ